MLHIFFFLELVDLRFLLNPDLVVPGELQDLVAFNATISACEKALEGTPIIFLIKMRSSGDPHRGIYSEKKSGIQSEILSTLW